MKNQKGFGGIETLLFLVIIGILVGAGWLVYDSKKKTEESLYNASKSQILTSKTNPYEDWKEYCDNATTGCYKYPSNWSPPSTESINLNLAFSQNPDASINVAYSKVNNIDGLGDFKTISISPLSSNKDYSVIAGYYTISNKPSYFIINTSLITEYDLSIGKTSNLGKAKGLYFTKDEQNLTFESSMNMKGGNPTVDIAETTAWFTSTDGKTAKLIAQSFLFK